MKVVTVGKLNRLWKNGIKPLVDNIQNQINGVKNDTVKKSGDVMTGDLTCPNLLTGNISLWYEAIQNRPEGYIEILSAMAGGLGVKAENFWIFEYPPEFMKGIVCYGDLRLGSPGEVATYGLNSDGSAKLLSLNVGSLSVEGHIISADSGGINLKTTAGIVGLYADEFRPGSEYAGKIGLGASNSKWGQIYSTKGTISTSDRNKKHDIETITEAYEKLFMELTPCKYMFNDGDRVHMGFISQDVEDAMNRLGMSSTDFAGFCKDIQYTYTEYGDDGEPIEETKIPTTDENGNILYDYSLRYDEFIALNTHMIQKTILEVEAQEQRISNLENQIRSLRSEFVILKNSAT